MGKYDDIIDIEWPMQGRPGQMTMQDRAKIFLPFAALKGYEEAIEERQKVTVARCELLEDMKEELDFRLGILEKEINYGNNPIITVIYFVEENKNSKLYDARTNDNKQLTCRDEDRNHDENGNYDEDRNHDEKGEYVKKTGIAVKINYTDMYLQVVEDKILLKNIYSIEGEIFGEYAIQFL